MLPEAISTGAIAACLSPPDGSPIYTQTRKRPLRTYGRRAAASKDYELPTSKRRRKYTNGTDSCHPEPSSPLPQLPTPELPKRTSILSYFKPATATSSGTASPAERPDASEMLQPPPSPPLVSAPRKRRRLTTRPDFAKKDIDSIAKIPQENDAKEKEDGTRVNKKHGQDTSPKGAHGAPFIAVSTLDLIQGDDNRSVIRETVTSSLNQAGPAVPHSSSSDSTAGEKRSPTANRPKKDMVQTTLSLAINPGPGFTICKECGILYNPLNEGDRKEHKRRHAAHIRSKSKSKS
ncbi:hypothetical protein B0H66DRAFT_569897 [Apodospora peruviana]|uniref:N-acetyltransferase ESCO zinc-finger domain-containing protein n=1 Tax=Apodospora peruviana TaxID=516989 RepID=A0AAE0HUQ6_9PEZI|nr:hypothetical protein B0H66DRAFT_569897 [Apodospora peruviana]